MIERLEAFLRRNGVDPDTFAVVFDIGSRDAVQAVELSRLFSSARVVAVECNPATLTLCRGNIAASPRITLVEKAINSHTGRCSFYPTDPARTVTSWPDGNPGASSLFLATGDYPPEKYVQKQIEVDCTRLDDLCGQLGIDVIDLIWIDLQGAELVAFQSAGALLDKVRYIFTEVSFRPIYKGQCLFDEVDAFLTARGFTRCSQINRARWQQDVIYKNSREFVDVLIPAGSEHRDIIDLSVRSVQNCVRNLRHIHVAGETDPAIANVRFFNQKNFPFEVGEIRGPGGDPGEYLQQLTKLYFPLVNKACLPDLVVVDPGTIFLEPCRFVQDGRPIFNFGNDYHPQTFEHMARLYPALHRMFAYSGISHCMLVRRAWLQELHNGVVAQHDGIPFWKAWLDAVDPSTCENGASEAELYFNFCLMFHAGELILRQFRWSRVSRIGEVPPDAFDYVSLLPDHRRNPHAARYWKPLLSSNRAALDPNDASAWTAYAGRLFDAGRFADCSDASDHALGLEPESVLAARHGIHARLHSCDWRRRGEDRQCITRALDAGENIIASVFHRAISDSESESRMLARVRAKDFARNSNPLWRGEIYRHEKIRIAYLSTDFRQHAVSSAIAGCLEQHDKTRFDTMAISLAADDGSSLRRRLNKAFDRFIDAEAMTDADISATLRKAEIDIAVDLNGYSGRRRTGILARRPAPLQVNYLGYPGTMGVPFMDYLIADPIVIPPENRTHYSEQVVYLPDTWLPAEIGSASSETPDRRAAGLPETGFVFACFNYIYKIGPEVFDIWMRLLRAVDGSILWLRSDEPNAIRNLRREAEIRSVAPERIIFAPFAPQAEQHLARLRLAGLFLDTLPYNAHVTACDALSAGLPLLTCTGKTFPGRAGSSVLSAIGLPELVTTSLAEYEEIALSLAQNPGRLAAIRSKLIRNRDTHPLFDTARFTRQLESAYEKMWGRQQSGLPPESFAVEEQ